MKFLVVLITLFAWYCELPAQNFSNTKETRLSYSEKLILINSELTIKFVVKEAYGREFVHDPLDFSKKNFSMKTYIKNAKKKEYHGYKVSLKSNHVYLLMEYDRNGELLYNFRRIKNKNMPKAVKDSILRSYKNWRVIKNDYVASGKQDKIDEEVYNIKINNGKESRTLRIHPRPVSSKGIANN